MQQRIDDTVKLERDDFRDTLQAIARGKPYPTGNKPLNGEEARQMARVTLVRHGAVWPRQVDRRRT